MSLSVHYLLVSDSVLGVYAKNGWDIKVLNLEYTLHSALSMLVAGILLGIRGIFVVSNDRGNIASLSLWESLGVAK